jgi:hypothetical protein
MKIINSIDPDFLAKLDRKNNIIMCANANDMITLTELENFPDTFGISLYRDVSLSASNVMKISVNALAATFRPPIKISFPAGLKIQFSEFIEEASQDVFWKIYKSFDLKSVFDTDNKLSHHLISDMVFLMYVDTIRMREVGLNMLLKKGMRIADFYFTWYVQTIKDMPQIENIYLISDSHVYEDFNNIF